MLVTTKEIAGVELFATSSALLPYGWNSGIGLLFEGGDITFQARVEE
ncbi:hypothetical protein ACNKHU_12320 [Shigella flexneri]